MITTILWDVDGTLLDFHYSQRKALVKCFESAGLSITDEIIERYSAINDDYWRRLELGEITREQLLNGRFISLFEIYGIEGVDVDAFRKKYQYWLGNIYAYIDDSLHVCKSLQAKVEQYVITNGVSSTQRTKLKLSGLANYMKELFISEEIGANKPDKAFFDVVLERLSEKNRDRILVVGDSLSSDIKGGINAGLKTCWYHNCGVKNESPWQSDYEITDLAQLEMILKNIP